MALPTEQTGTNGLFREPFPLNLIEVMADERWKRLAAQQGFPYAKTVAEAMKLKLDMDNPADREKLRRAVLDLVAGRKMPKQKALPSVGDCYVHHRMNFPCSCQE